ncbi:GxxExxY protein [Desulfobacterales bacterium HSG2]|nr:GxxExxY protein [Desulfobacterales bacterium HSG2]
MDVLADERLVIELKAKAALLPVDKAQVITYLRVTGLKLGILVNFGGEELEIIRIPNFVSDRPARPFRTGAAPSSDQWLYPALTRKLRAVLYEVHGELRPDFMHMHYRRAVQIELGMRSIPYEVKKEIVIPFRQQPVETRETRMILVDGKVLLVPTAVLGITPKLIGRLRQYLRLLELKIGLVANFHTSSLEIEVVRI